jgi:hypothetical protein
MRERSDGAKFDGRQPRGTAKPAADARSAPVLSGRIPPYNIHRLGTRLGVPRRVNFPHPL